jgi:hypothetical protein
MTWAGARAGCRAAGSGGLARRGGRSFGVDADHGQRIIQAPDVAARVVAVQPGVDQEHDDPRRSVAGERGEGDIAVATNGGFAQVAGQSRLGEEGQRAKLELVEIVSRYYWGNEI